MPWHKTLIGRLAALLMTLIAAFAVLQFFWFAQATRRSIDASDQRINSSTAGHLAARLQPLLNGAVNEWELQRAVARFHAVSPSAEVSIIDSSGAVRYDFAGADLEREKPIVDIAAVRGLLEQGDRAELPITGTCLSDRQGSIFSVAPITFRNQPGFLYVALHGKHYIGSVNPLEAVPLSYRTLLSTIVGFFVILAAGAGTVLYLSRRYRRIVHVVASFGSGRTTERVTITGKDELGQLGAAIDDMADHRSRTLQELANRDVERRELITMLAHDLRGPLANIAGFADMLARGGEAASLDEQQRRLSGVDRNVLSLKQLLESLSQLARLELADEAPCNEAFSVSRLLLELADANRDRAAAKGITLRLEADAADEQVIGDSSMIFRALTNLVENAVRFTPPGGSILLGCQARGERVSICVRDTGHGIAPDDLGRIFEKFYQAPTPQQAEGGSAGLGLAIVRQLLALHGTSLAVESALDVGTTMSFSLARSSKSEGG